jgi:early secretory antigenic target protein ESAT-6
MTRYQVDVDAVSQASTQARATIDRLHQDVASLTHTLHTLSSIWTGAASAAFTDLYSAWHITQSTLETQLVDITTALAQAGQHYQDMEAANVALFRR